MKTPKECSTKTGLSGAYGIEFTGIRLSLIGSFTLIVLLLMGTQSGFAQSNVHRFAAIASQPDRTISLNLLGSAPSAFLKYYDLYPLEGSTNLVDWTPLGTLVRTNLSTNALVYLDADASGLRHRFYRMPTNQLLTALAKPSGPYAVGRTTRVLVDASRTNRYMIATNSSFMVSGKGATSYSGEGLVV